MSVVEQPYGRDTSTRFTSRGARVDYGRLVSGKRLLAEACLRRLITERGTVLDAPNYGFPIVNLLGQAQTAAGRAAIPGLVRLELQKDARVDSVDVRVTVDESRRPSIALLLEITVTGVETGPFDLVVSVDELGVKVLSLPEET